MSKVIEIDGKMYERVAQFDERTYSLNDHIILREIPANPMPPLEIGDCLEARPMTIKKDTLTLLLYVVGSIPILRMIWFLVTER